MEEGTFSGWQKTAGTTIHRGEVLFELEGEKALQEIEAIDEGILWIPPDAPRPGAVLKVGAVIGYLLAPNELPPNTTPGQTPQLTRAPADGETAAPASNPAPASASPAASAPPAAPPSVRRLARELHVPINHLNGSGPGGRITEDDVRNAAAAASGTTALNAPEPIATPRARRAAATLGIDWKTLRGTGRDGRIRERDVLAAAPQTAAPTAAPVPASQWLPIAGRRQVIARRMQTSRQNTVPVTLTARVNAAGLVSLRNQFRSAELQPVPAYHDILAKLTAECLVQHPLLAARHERGGLLLPDPAHIHLGLAVDTPEGLIVPVLRDVRLKSLPQLAAYSAECITHARSGRLSPLETEGSVFTLSSLGSLGVDAFTPVINYPEVAILGIGAIRQVPVVLENDRLTVGQELTLSLTFDHQALDGAPAARFLQTLTQAIENPAAKLLSQPPV
jgi:pyruvate dehydrogenase E2 component (dihydrolipoamide acetyltransferase)